MADNKTQINRRINPYLSFSLEALFTLLILVELHIDVLHVSATNRCTEFQFLVLHADGATSCVDCGSCPPGQGLSHECGTKISSREMVHCIPCIQGSSFSTDYDTLSCILCSASCSEDQLVNQTCTTTSDVKCAQQCNSKDRYYDELTGDCQQCSKCCGDAQDVIEDECKRKMGAASNIICSFQSSVNRCDSDADILPTSSPQETSVLQTGTNTIASTQDTTTSKEASTASQRDIAMESPKVTTAFKSTFLSVHFTQKISGTVTSSGEIRSLQDSYKAKDSKHQVAVIVGITVAVVLVLGLPLLAGYVHYYRSSRSRSCSMRANIDTESGEYHLVNGTAAGMMSCKGDRRERKALKIKWEKSKSESSDPLCLKVNKNSEDLKCACQMVPGKESKLLKSLLNEESTLRTLCEMLDAKAPKLGDYKDVALYYGFNHYQLNSVLGLASYPGEPTRTRALIMSLASSHPDLRVEEFATVVDQEANRSDVSGLLRDYDTRGY